MIDPTPRAISGPVTSEGGSLQLSPASPNVRAPQSSDSSSSISELDSPAPTSPCSPQNISLVPESVDGKEPVLRSDPQAYIPPPAGTSLNNEEDRRLRSSPQVYPEQAHSFDQPAVPAPVQGYAAYEVPHDYLLPYSQPFSQPTYAQPAAIPEPVSHLQMQETPHLPLDFIPLPSSSHQAQQTPSHIPASVLARLPDNTSQTANGTYTAPATSITRPSQPYPTPTATTATAFHATNNNIDRPHTPIKIVPERRGSRRRLWLCMCLLILIAVAIAAGVVVSKNKSENKDSDNDKGQDEANPTPKGQKQQATSSTSVFQSPTHSFASATTTTTSTAATMQPAPPPPQQPPPPANTGLPPEYWDCRRKCSSESDNCESSCRAQDSWKSCTADCANSSNQFCEFDCKVSLPCFQSCHSVWGQCSSACG